MPDITPVPASIETPAGREGLIDMDVGSSPSYSGVNAASKPISKVRPGP